MRTQRWMLALVAVSVTALPAAAQAQFLVARTPTDIATVDAVTGETSDRFDVDAVGATARGIEWSGDDYLVSDASTGEIRESDETFATAAVLYSVPPGNSAAGIARIGSILYVNGQSDVQPDTLFAMDIGSGTVLNRFPMPAEVTTLGDLAAVDGDLFGVETASGGNVLWKIDALTGAFVESHDLPSTAFAVAGDAATNEVLYVNNTDRVVYALNPDTGATTPRVTLVESDFILTMTYRSVAVPVRSVGWSALKQQFD